MADPDLQIGGWGGGGGGGLQPPGGGGGGGGGGLSRPGDEVGAVSKNIFTALGPQFGLKIRGSRAPRAPSLGRPLVCLIW